MEESYKRIAAEIADHFFDTATPRPSAGPVKLRALVIWALSHGYSRKEIEQGLREVATFSLPALEFVLRKAHVNKGPRPNISTWDRRCPLELCEGGCGWVVCPERPDTGMVRCACNPEHS